MRIFLKFYRITSVVICVWMLYSVRGQSVAQDSSLPEPILTFQVSFPGSLHWSSDSQNLIFYDINLSRWYVYDVQTQLITQLVNQPTIKILFDCPTSSKAFYDNLSHNARYATYTEEIEQYSGFAVARLNIIDCSKKSTYLLPDEIQTANRQRVIWSNDNRAFLFVNLINPPSWIEAQYVTNYHDDVSNAVLFHTSPVWDENKIYTVYGAYDISFDGSKLLLHVAEGPTDAGTLYISNMKIPSNSQFIGVDFETLIAATYAPNDESKLWLFTELGIVQYDLVSKETSIINNAINSEEARGISISEPAVFSPDGRYLATLGQDGLYVIDLTQEAQLLETSTQNQNSQPEPAGISRLYLQIECPSSTTELLNARIYNPNPTSLDVTWQLGLSLEGLAKGTLEVPAGSEDAPGEIELEVEARSGNNDVLIFVDDVLHDYRSCRVPRSE
jgi:hypothetical protein